MAANMLQYRPKKKYQVKSESFILGKIKQAKTMADGIRALAEQVDTDQQLKTNTMDHMVALFEGSHNLGIPASKRYVAFDAKSAKPADVIFRALGMLNVPPKIHYIGPKGSPREEKRVDAIEKFLNAYAPWLWRKYGVRWDIQNRFWQLLVGRSYLQQSYLPFYWDKQIRKRQKGESDSEYTARVDGYKGFMGPPLFVESLDPRMVFPVMTPMGPEAYVKIYKVQRFELNESLARVGKMIEFDPDGKVFAVHDLDKAAGLELPRQAEDTLSNPVDYFEYVDDVMCYYVVGDHVVHKYKHDGGVKIFPAYGLQTGFKEHHLAAMGLLWAVRNEIPQFDFLRTLWVQKAYLDVFPQLFAQLADDEMPLAHEDGTPRQWDIEPGTVKQIRGVLINALKESGSGMDFRAALEAFAGDIDLATISSLMRGIAGAQQPGYSINQLMQTTRTQWKPIVESAELQMSMLYEHTLWVLKNVVGEPTTIFAEIEDTRTGRRSGDYVTLDPDSIQDWCRVDVSLEPELPIDKQGNMLTWWKLHQEGGATFEDYVREGLGKTNPLSMKEQIMKDMAERAWLPEAIKDAMALGRVQLTNEILQQRGLDRLNAIGNLDVQALKEARAKQQLAQSGMPPMQGGGAPMPGTPTGGPPGELGPEPPQPIPATAGAGPGIEPTYGANPNDPAPGYRGP